MRLSRTSMASAASDGPVQPDVGAFLHKGCEEACKGKFVDSANSIGFSTLGLRDQVVPEFEEADTPMGHIVTHFGKMEVKMEVPTNSLRFKVLNFVRHDYFRNFITITIWVNLAQFGASVQWKEEPWHTVWITMEQIFTCIFGTEMVLKVIAYNLSYFKDVANIIDFTLAWLAIGSSFMLLLGVDTVHLTAFRLLRIFRALRAARALKEFRSLYLFVEAFADAMVSMGTIGLVMLLVIYLLAIICYSLFDVFGTPPDLASHFASVPSAMLSLFNMVLLTEWANIIWPVSRTHPWMVLIFTAFILFTNFGVMNVAIGIVVNHAQSAADQQQEEDIQARKREQMKEVTELVEFFRSLDTDHNQNVSKKELKEASKDERFQDVVRRMGLPAGFTLADLYIMLDSDANGYLTGTEFVKGMFRAVHNDDFQRSCMIHLSVNEVKLLILQNRQEILSAFEQFTEHVTKQLAGLRSEKSRTGEDEPKMHKRCLPTTSNAGCQTIPRLDIMDGERNPDRMSNMKPASVHVTEPSTKTTVGRSVDTQQRCKPKLSGQSDVINLLHNALSNPPTVDGAICCEEPLERRINIISSDMVSSAEKHASSGALTMLPLAMNGARCQQGQQPLPCDSGAEMLARRDFPRQGQRSSSEGSRCGNMFAVRHQNTPSACQREVAPKLRSRGPTPKDNLRASDLTVPVPAAQWSAQQYEHMLVKRSQI